MEKMNIVKSIADMKELLERNSIIDKSNNVAEEIIFVSVKLVPRKGLEDNFYMLETVIDNYNEAVNEDTLPELTKATRADIIEFYNNKLTNTVNRALANHTAITTVTGKMISQRSASIDDYTGDIDDLIDIGGDIRDIKIAIESLQIQYGVNLPESFNDYMETWYPFEKEKENPVLPLLYVEKFNVVFNTKIKQLHNSRLLAGETMIMDDLTDVLNNHNNISHEIENILYNDNIVYSIVAIDRGKWSIRIMNLDELTARTKITYNK